MTAVTDHPPAASADRRRDRRRKAKAILAAGLVLGVGAAVTLAAWNDSEFAQSTFTAGTFDLEGAEGAGTAFTEHATSGAAAALEFTAPVDNLAPGDSVYAAFAVRLKADTTTDASVTFAGVTTTGTVTNLSYGVALVTAAGTANCTSTSFAGGTSVIADGTAITSVGTPTAFTLLKGSPVTTSGAAQYLCFKVTAGSGLDQGQTGTATWQIQAISTT